MSTLFVPLLNRNELRGRTLSAPMQAPPASPSFGEYLREIRDTREGLSLGAVVIRLARLGIQTDRGTISRYERDKRLRLDPLVLWGLADVYGEPIERMCAELAERSGLKVEAIPSSRLTETEENERKVIRLFRRAPSSVQREITELLEFKVRRSATKGETNPPQPRAVVGRRTASRRKTSRSR
jgi:transcriptional regulator with XRE-family HTH domain